MKWNLMILLYLFNMLPLFVYCQNSNLLILESDIIAYRNYRGTSIKEISVKSYNLSLETDTIGEVVAMQYFDLLGNRTKSVAYEKGIEVYNHFYKYDSINRLISTYCQGKDTFNIENIKYDKNNNIIFFRKIYINENYVNFKCKYDDMGMPIVLSRDLYFSIKWYTMVGNNYELAGLDPTKDSRKFWIYYKYYSDENTKIKSISNPRVIKEYCKLDKNKNIVNIKSIRNGKLIKDLSIKYNDDKRIMEKVSSSEIDSDKLFRQVYTYRYY